MMPNNDRTKKIDLVTVNVIKFRALQSMHARKCYPCSSKRFLILESSITFYGGQIKLLKALVLAFQELFLQLLSRIHLTTNDLPFSLFVASKCFDIKLQGQFTQLFVSRNQDSELLLRASIRTLQLGHSGDEQMRESFGCSCSPLLLYSKIKYDFGRRNLVRPTLLLQSALSSKAISYRKSGTSITLIIIVIIIWRGI